MTRIFNKPELEKYRSRLRNNQTDAERKLWSKLRKRQFFGHRFVRQFSIGKFIVDFYSPQLRVAIELDGGQHNSDQNKFYDQKRSDYLKSLGIRVVRFWDNELLNNMEGVLEKLTEHITPPHLPFPKRGGK
ncbi:MAG: hypothetical protein UV61_C0004G0038 [Candidatus Gottesmanbacteria bacterium GW2011_GWB1_43_11]|uniref:DUF559 domain-containing protein n=1 Tax=Candidatus Gottesmanbacteria bacterium GW2011_GWB1_43_11 TaxID=1618446 RepID=A0A0G1CNR4_9BACT|nr:MAG: hypothetical protein UV04_C0007G0039 [Candidatus Gottesmanbacteria bacterium GW2011_GWA2_42_16]KKS55621.1 MAG: hypothetical protein UV17_C0009G0002 [Candidatus Gottesmanbacteria bacterium GW2011_GWA1_42_26]KKS82214.1 MAG: hypothetical protein UV55_C0004G0030 [Candidatus Gottesmanbacteria bacterium GW2011_GWC1_43_10]KKS87112.1 MAG: hypothetical protein UV61_C0004G0038 [Candidatus Gottesmanbacteria bacterium GW2011_GWB1_43_11]OGG10400.1 MAG: hypothetical protein A2699_05025 [Candidatus Go